MASTPLTRMIVYIMFLGVIAVAILGSGCTYSYAPIKLETPDGHVSYRLTIKEAKGSYRSRLTRQQDGESRFLSLKGKAESMALSPNEQLLAIALSTSSPEIPHRVIILESDTLKLTGQLPITMPDVTREPDEYRPTIQRFDLLAISHDSRLLATYFWKPSRQGGHESVIVLWNLETGRLLRELQLPDPNGPLQRQILGENVSSMVFSQDDAFLAVSGAWSIKDPHVEQPDGFISVWSLSDGKQVATWRPEGSRFLWNLCFDESAAYVAASTWGNKDTQQSVVTIWALPPWQGGCQEIL